MRNVGQSIRLLVAGGGTGGHIFPAIAIADAVRALLPSSEILFVGAEGRMEMQKVPAAGYNIEGLPMRGLPRGSRRPSEYIRFATSWWKSFHRARQLVKSFQPDVAVGVGGYASVAALQAAQLRGIPTIIQEQNGYAGKANRLLSKRAKAVCVAYPDMERYFRNTRIKELGNPVRAEFLKPLPPQNQARQLMELPTTGRVVLVMGGSLGASQLCRATLNAYEQLAQAEGVTVMLQTGKQNYSRVVEAVAQRGGMPQLKVVEFINDMPAAYSAADFIVSRAGAIAISELCIVAKPLILVPSPNVAEDHQTKNANVLVAHNAAELIPDHLAVESLGDALLNLMRDSERCEMYSTSLGKLAKPAAAEEIAKLVIKAAKGEESNA